jgi:hypothetical protein
MNAAHYKRQRLVGIVCACSLLLLACALLLAMPAAASHGGHYYGAWHGSHATTHRDPEVRKQFQREHPCPSTGKTSGACPGYVRDHITPLCKGGADATWNLQWQTQAAGKAKDKWECK